MKKIALIGSPGSGKSVWIASLIYYLMGPKMSFNGGYRKIPNREPITNWRLAEKIKGREVTPIRERPLKVNNYTTNFSIKGKVPPRTPPKHAVEISIILERTDDPKEKINLFFLDISGELMYTYLFFHNIVSENIDTLFDPNTLIIKARDISESYNQRETNVIHNYLHTFEKILLKYSNYLLIIDPTKFLISEDDEQNWEDACTQRILIDNFIFFLKKKRVKKPKIKNNLVVILTKGDLVEDQIHIGQEYNSIRKWLWPLFPKYLEYDKNLDIYKDFILCSSTGSEVINGKIKILPPKAWDVTLPLARLLNKMAENNIISKGATDDDDILEYI